MIQNRREQRRSELREVAEVRRAEWAELVVLEQR